MEFSFSHPENLYLLILVPLIFVIHFYSLNHRKKSALKFANFQAISRIQGVDFFSKNIVMLVLGILLVLSLVFAVSGLRVHTMMEATSFSFVIAVDSSTSMEANDLVPDRIGAAKETAKSFVDGTAPDTKFGVVSFSGGSTIESSMQTEKSKIKEAIDQIELNNYGGTDLFDAIFTSVNLLDGESNKAIILLSDGQVNAGNELDKVIYYANSNDVIIHTIAMGTKQGGVFGTVLSKLDEETLQALAYNTEGIYFTAESGENILDAFDEIMQKTERKVTIETRDYLLFAALLFFILIFFFSNTRYVNLP